MSGYSKLMLYLLQFLCFAVVCQSIPPRIILWKTTREEFVPPAIASFICEANGTGILEFEWLKDGEVFSKSNPKYTSNKRDGVGGSKIEILTIKDIVPRLKPEDEGFYQCRVRNAYGVAVSNTTWLKNFKLEAGPSDIQNFDKNEGDSLILPCPQKALSSSPDVKWIKASEDGEGTSPKAIVVDQRIQVNENGDLVFSYLYENDKTTDNEVYKCVLINRIDLVTSVVGSQYRLTVTKQPHRPSPSSLIALIASVVPKVALVGRDVTLSCLFSGEQNTIVYYDASGHELRSTSASPVTGTQNEKTIKNVAKSHQGKYSCTGTSKDGKLTQTEYLQIDVQARPVFREQPRDQNATHGSVAEFKCVANADPPANIQWFKDGVSLNENSLPNRMQLSSDKTSLKIYDICKENCKGAPDRMVVQCNASNAHGYAFANGYLNVLFKTEITKRPVDIEYNPEEVAVFECDATTDRDTKLTYRWLFDGKPFTHGSINTSINILRLDLPRLEGKGNNLIGTWTCEASNSYSTDRQSAKLREKYVPAWPYWWVVLLALLLFLLVLLIICIVCCCLYKNRGDQYPVDEIEQKNGNNPEKELEEAGFHDYQRDLLLPRSDSATGTLSSQDRTISRQKRSQGSLSGTLGRGSNENLN